MDMDYRQVAVMALEALHEAGVALDIAGEWTVADSCIRIETSLTRILRSLDGREE